MTRDGRRVEPVTLPELAQRHDVFFVDQFGVLHDGIAAYPGAVEALSKLKATGATIVLLSNSGKRTGPNEDRLLGLGFQRGSWDLFLSSGEIAWRMFSGLEGRQPMRPGCRCLLLARDNDRTAVEGLDIELVDRGEDAEVVLLAGSEGEHFAMDVYREILLPAARRHVPLICSNPDRIMLTKSGPRFGAGRIAELYEELGGSVTWIGKPYAEIYEAALRDLGNPQRDRVVAVGDSIEHDIVGARGAGLFAALVRSGILADLTNASLAALYEQHAVRPDYVLKAFVWTGR